MALGLACSARLITDPTQSVGVYPFRTEAKLVSVFERQLEGSKDFQRWRLLREFESVDGIADLVFFKPNLSSDRALQLAGIPPRWAYALRALPYKKQFSVGEFAAWTGVTGRHAGRILESYRAQGFCELGDSRNVWIKLQRPQVLTTRIFAIEAKLRDWKRALRQAYRYQDYACQSWVLLDSSSVRPAIANLSDFVRLNVGLASLSSNEEVSVHFTPRTSLPRSAHRFWQANAEIAQRLESGSQVLSVKSVQNV